MQRNVAENREYQTVRVKIAKTELQFGFMQILCSELQPRQVFCFFFRCYIHSAASVDHLYWLNPLTMAHFLSPGSVQCRENRPVAHEGPRPDWMSLKTLWTPLILPCVKLMSSGNYNNEGTEFLSDASWTRDYNSIHSNSTAIDELE